MLSAISDSRAGPSREEMERKMEKEREKVFDARKMSVKTMNAKRETWQSNRYIDFVVRPYVTRDALLSSRFSFLRYLDQASI